MYAASTLLDTIASLVHRHTTAITLYNLIAVVTEKEDIDMNIEMDLIQFSTYLSEGKFHKLSH